MAIKYKRGELWLVRKRGDNFLTNMWVTADSDEEIVMLGHVWTTSHEMEGKCYQVEVDVQMVRKLCDDWYNNMQRLAREVMGQR